MRADSDSDNAIDDNYVDQFKGKIPNPEEIEKLSRMYNLHDFIIIEPASLIDKILSDVTQSFNNKSINRTLFGRYFSWHSISLVSFPLNI
jgi:hypothetical protein